MDLPGQLKVAVTRTLWLAMGRRNLVRLGRMLSNEGRLDIPNRMDRNGEMLVQEIFLRHGSGTRPVFAFDVGANVGEWSLAFASKAVSMGLDGVHVYAFEPCVGTHRSLTRNIANLPAAVRVTAVPMAASNRAGTGELIVVGDGEGTNALAGDQVPPGSRIDRVELTTLDDFCKRSGIPGIGLLKIDAEGHDLHVMEGAVGLLKSHMIDVVQFEYNWRWINSRCFLRDAFSLLQPLGYRIGKVTPRAIEFYDHWHFELETWREANYLACLESWVPRFPRIPWWNEER